MESVCRWAVSGTRSQIARELGLVTRRQQGGDEDQIRYAQRQRAHRILSRAREYQLGADALENGGEGLGLPQVRLEG